MAAITSLGIGSGADLNTLVTQLVAAERQPLTQMRAAATSLQTQVSSFGRLSSQLGALQTAASRLTAATLWQQNGVTSSNESAVTVQGGAGAAPGSYQISVERLAKGQTLASATALSAATEPVGSGQLTIELGRWQPPDVPDDPPPPMNFVPMVGRDAVTIDVSEDDTLATLRDKINSADAGVTASLVSDSSGVRLALRSNTTGAENAFRIQANDNDGTPADNAGLSRFAFDLTAGTTGMLQRQAAVNALAEVNGIAVESATNELSGVVEGLTFRLRKEDFGTAEVSVASDREAVRSAIQGFADAYSELAKTIADQTRFDPATRQGGPLQGDSAVGSLQRQLRALVNAPSGASGTLGRLSDAGLELQRDGTLKVNSAKLDSAMGNLEELRKAFANNDLSNPANDGFARRYADLAGQVLGVDGTLTSRTQSLQRRLAQNSDEQARLNDRVDRFQQRLVQQYTALDTNLARLNALSSSLTQQLNRLNPSNNNNG